MRVTREHFDAAVKDAFAVTYAGCGGLVVGIYRDEAGREMGREYKGDDGEVYEYHLPSPLDIGVEDLIISEGE